MDGGEVSTRPGSISHRGSSGLRETSTLDRSALKLLIETLEESKTAHEAVPNPFS